MGIINIHDSFWRDVTKVIAVVGDHDKAIGQAIRFFALAQERYKRGRTITETEFQKEGFTEALIGAFAERVEGGIMAIDAEFHFGWLRKKAQAGRKGGLSKSQKKSDAAVQREKSRREINDLTTSNQKHSVAPVSTHNPYSFTLEDNTIPSKEGISSDPAKLHWLAELWNKNRNGLPFVARISSKNLKRIQLRVKENPDVEYWEKVFKKAAASDFLNGKSDRGFKADFWWLTKNDENSLKTWQGNYDNRVKNALSYDHDLSKVQSEIDELQNINQEEDYGPEND